MKYTTKSSMSGLRLREELIKIDAMTDLEERKKYLDQMSHHRVMMLNAALETVNKNPDLWNLIVSVELVEYDNGELKVWFTKRNQ